MANIGSTEVFKTALNAARHLAELKGLCATLPDPALLLNSIVLQESKDSSAIENIVTTQDELYRAETGDVTDNSSAKEVLRYREAMYTGLKYMQEHQNLITTNGLIQIVQIIKNNQAAIRNQPGTQLRSNITNKIIYTPPCCEPEIRQKMAELEKFINDDSNTDIDPLIKLGMIHYQFEAIHPFADGNGRAGRILNNLYLVQQNLLTQPILYLSAYIAEHKQDYYQLLRRVTEQQQWNEWLLFILTAINKTAQLTTQKIRDMLQLKQAIETKMKAILKSSYKSELLQLLFEQPYIKIDTIVLKKIAHRETASGYLKKLANAEILEPQKKGRTTYYINRALVNIMSNKPF